MQTPNAALPRCRTAAQWKNWTESQPVQKLHKFREDGSKRLADNTLVALTLMIAESKTEEKDVMVKVVVNLINQKNE